MNEHKPCCERCLPHSKLGECYNPSCSCHKPDEPKTWRERFDDEFVGNKELDYLRPTRPDHLRGFIAQVEAEAEARGEFRGAQRAQAEAIRECAEIVRTWSHDKDCVTEIAMSGHCVCGAAMSKALTDKLKES